MMTPQDRAKALIAGLALMSPHQSGEQLEKTIAGQFSAALRDLLRLTGKVDRCSCGATVYLVRHLGNPNYVIYSESSGMLHQLECQD